jgi:hypothetical protein
MARAKAKKAETTTRMKAKTKATSKARTPQKKAAAKSSAKRVVKKATPKKAAKKPAAKKPARKPVAARSAAKKSAAKKAAPRKTAAKKAAPKKAAVKKSVAKKPVRKKTAAKKTVAKKAVTKKHAVRKTAAKPARKAVAKKAGTKKTPSKAAKKPVARKSAARSTGSKAPTKRVVDKARKAAKKKTAPPPGGEKKKAGIAEVKAAAVRTRKKVSKRGRKRQRVTPTSTPLANWIPKDGLRPSSFLPAPPRAQSAFTVAAAPASSDRLVREEDLAPPAPIRTIPVLVHVVQESGRIEVRTNPTAVEAAPGDAVEWDFRYFGGADVLVTQVAIDISRPSPFGKTSYKSAKPGSARPHRCVSDIVKDKALDTTTEYTIHCTNAFKTELARGTATVVIREAEPTDAAH